jgi:tRNA threonylcarbamoyladenosine modification (KEOPS) complex  Pcc1 subunit
MSSRLTINVGESEIARRLCIALLPEIKSNKSKAASIKLNVEGPNVIISITSSTIAATRALLNSYIRWISISIDIVSMKS